MSGHQETNPHFQQPPQQREGQRHETPPVQGVSRPQRQDQQNQPRRPRLPRETQPQSKGQGASAVQPQHEGQYHTPWVQPVPLKDYPESHFPLRGQFSSPWQQLPQHQGQHPQPHDGQRHGQLVQSPQGQAQDYSGRVAQPQHQDQGQGARVTQPQHSQQGHGPGLVSPPQQRDNHRQRHGLMPKIGRTNPITWLGASICVIFWIVIFLGGLIVLIVYLAYRPRSPRFDVSSATLNAAYIDSGSLLNADVSVLANFSNPNKKVSVDFSYAIIDLYYGSTLIATQYIEPFSASKAESRFANVHMLTSQVRLPLMESERLQKQIDSNGVIFEVKGVFRVRSNLGSFLRYSYRLYGHCTIMVTSPPSGVLRATKCRTKR